MKRLRILMGTALALPVMLFAPMVATAATTTDTTSTAPAPAAAAAASAKEKAEETAKRLEASKKKFVVKLTPADEARLKARCKMAQTKATTLTTTIAKNNTARVAAYAKVTTKVDKLITKLQDQNIDSKKLEGDAAALKALIKTYTEDLAAYQTALSDVNNTDCVTDPTTFKVNLEAARAARTGVATDAAAIRTYISETLKATLKETKVSLAQDTTKKTEGAQ
jgi:hypothetical protein